MNQTTYCLEHKIIPLKKGHHFLQNRSGKSTSPPINSLLMTAVAKTIYETFIVAAELTGLSTCNVIFHPSPTMLMPLLQTDLILLVIYLSNIIVHTSMFSKLRKWDPEMQLKELPPVQ